MADQVTENPDAVAEADAAAAKSSAEDQKAELQALKSRADTMGISYPNNITLKTLREKVKAGIEGKPQRKFETVDAAEPAEKRPETEQEIRERLKRDKMKLVRCRIYNLNPAKRELPGEIICVANKYLGDVKKFIPFGEATEDGYHIPQVLFDDLKARRFQQVKTRTVRGNIEVDARMVPEYQLEVLPMLTPEELKELATNQQAAERVTGRN